jgi:hypothetical protein
MFCVADSFKADSDAGVRPVATNPRSFFNHVNLPIKTLTENTNGFYKKDENGDLLYNCNYADRSQKPKWKGVPGCPRVSKDGFE